MPTIEADFNLAYPPADTVVRNYLLNAPSTSQERECKAYLRSLLWSLFSEAWQQLDGLCHSDATMPYEQIAKKFYDFFAQTLDRSRFYSKVILKAGSQTSTSDVVHSFREFTRALMGLCLDWPRTACPVLISMDEIHVLFNMRVHDTESDYSLYSRLKSVLSEVVSEDFCTIFLSTATSVSKLAPSKDVAPSARERDDERLLPAPFTELPFDAYIASEPLVPGKATLNTVGSLKFTSKFGRPLYVDLE